MTIDSPQTSPRLLDELSVIKDSHVLFKLSKRCVLGRDLNGNTWAAENSPTILRRQVAGDISVFPRVHEGNARMNLLPRG